MDRYYILAGESLAIFERFRAGRRAVIVAFQAIGERYGLEAMYRDGAFSVSFGGLLAPGDIDPPAGWRRRREQIEYQDKDGKMQLGTIFVPARSTRAGRAIGAEIRALTAPGSCSLMAALDGDIATLEMLGAHPGIDTLPSGEVVMVCKAEWPAPKGAREIKPSEYFAAKGM